MKNFYKSQFIQELDDMKFPNDQAEKESFVNQTGERRETLQSATKNIIDSKYFEAFNFYFSKPTNEMIVNIDTPHVIMFKDYLYYDDINEFFKRPYESEEAKIKMKNLIDFYHKEDNVFPALSSIDQNRIIGKRCSNMYKYYDRVIRGIQPDLSDSLNSGQSQSNDGKGAGSRVLTSNFQEQLLKSKFDDQYEDSQGGNYQYESFESVAFDIWNPDYSGYSSFGSSIEKYANKFSTNSPLSSRLEMNMDMSQFSMISNDKSDLLMLQEFISRTDDNAHKQSGGKIVPSRNKNFKKTKSPQRKSKRSKSRKQAQKPKEEQSDKKRERYKMQIKSSTSLANMRNFMQKNKKKGTTNRSETASEMRMRLMNLKVKMNMIKSQNTNKGKKVKRRPQSTHRFKKASPKRKRKFSKNEKQLNFKGLHKKKFSQKLIKLTNRKSSGKKQRNSVNSKKKVEKFIRKKFGSQHKGQFTSRALRSPSEFISTKHNSSVKNGFLKKFKKKGGKLKNNTNSNTPQRDYNFNLNLNKLKQKIYSDKNPISLEDFAKKAGFWSSRSHQSNLNHAKKKRKEKQSTGKARQLSKKSLKTARMQKKNISPYKRHSNALTQSQPTLIGLKKARKGKRRSQENIKAVRYRSAKRQLSQQCKTEPASLRNTSLGHNFKYKSQKLRTSKDNLQKTRKLIEKFKEKVKQKEMEKNQYYFYQQ